MVSTRTSDDQPQFGQEELKVLLRELDRVIGSGVPGDVVELGCYLGETSVVIGRALQSYSPPRRLHAYDSFEGLPAKAPQDESPAGAQFRAGELPATKREVVERLKRSGVGNARVKKAWFSDLQPSDLPETICLAFLDGDFYESIRDSLRLVWPKLAPGAVVVVDDYQAEALPGVKKALDVWAQKHQFTIKIESSLAILEQQ